MALDKIKKYPRKTYKRIRELMELHHFCRSFPVLFSAIENHDSSEINNLAIRYFPHCLNNSSSLPNSKAESHYDAREKK